MGHRRSPHDRPWAAVAASAETIQLGLPRSVVFPYPAGATTETTGLRHPSRRRAAAITAWMIIPAGFGWLVLTSRLLGGS